MNYHLYLHVFKELILCDLTIFRKLFFDKFIDIAIWVIITLVVNGYIMQYFGLQKDFGSFQLAGALASTALFEMFGNVVDLVSDFEHDRVINYHLTLPIPSWLTLLSKATYYAITYFILSLCMLPIGKLALWNQFDIWHISHTKLFITLLSLSIFYAAFLLWISSFIKNMTAMGQVWSRFIFPLWFLGGFQFSWIALHNAIPLFAYFDLINPMIYITESTRVSLLGQAGFLPFWICMSAIAIFSTFILADGIRRLKIRLDFV